MPEPLKINTIFAFIATDPDGNEGVAAFQDDSGVWFPMVGADMERANSLKKMAQQLARTTGCSIKLCQFITREEIEVINPR